MKSDGSYFVDKLEPLKTFEPLDIDVENIVTVDDKPELLEDILEEIKVLITTSLEASEK